MAQPQSHMPAQAFTAGQLSPSTGPQLASSYAPPPKRQRISPGPQPQQISPYPTAGYVTSPGAHGSPVASGSPAMPTMAGIASYTTPYSNGNTPTLNLPAPQPMAIPTMPTPPGLSAGQSPSTPYAPYLNATLAPMPTGPPTPSVMGPPSKPAERPAKEYQYDVDDSLAGTGIDLRQEEQFQADYFAGVFRNEAKTGFPANPPGNRASFYGAGFANQAAQPTDEEDQIQLELLAAKQAWTQSAKALATSRSIEARNPFLNLPIIHSRMDKITQEHGISINLDPKPNTGIGRMRADYEFPQPTVEVSTKVGPDGVFVVTSGSFIPEDAYLADQVALLSLATKHRLRELVEEASMLALTRQQTSHGLVPDEWIDAAAPLVTGETGPGDDASPGPGNESAVSPRTNPLKRTFEVSNSGDALQKAVQISTTNVLAQGLREAGKDERNSEETRLRKRQKLEEKKTNPTSASRAGSVAAGTPGAIAPEPEKPLTKKEIRSKEKAAQKIAEASTTTSANKTSMAFLGFGRKKQYSWLSQAGSGASTPTRPGVITASSPGSPAGTPAPRLPDRLTTEGRTRIGTWREDGEKGKSIQLRDWVMVLEKDAKDVKALEVAYDKLDSSQPK